MEPQKTTPPIAPPGKVLEHALARRIRKPATGGMARTSRGPLGSNLTVPISEGNLLAIRMLTPEERDALKQAIEDAEAIYQAGLARLTATGSSRHDQVVTEQQPTPPVPASEPTEDQGAAGDDDDSIETIFDGLDKGTANTPTIEIHSTIITHETGPREDHETDDGTNQPTDGNEVGPETVGPEELSSGEGDGSDADAPDPLIQPGTETTDDAAVQAALLAAISAGGESPPQPPSPTETTPPPRRQTRRTKP